MSTRPRINAHPLPPPTQTFKRIMFDYDVGTHRQKEDFLKKKKRCNVPFELHYVKECQRLL